MKIKIHSDRLGFRLEKRLSDDWWQTIFSIRPWVIWTRKGQIGKAKPGKKEKKKVEGEVLAETVKKTGPWTAADQIASWEE